MLSLPFSHSVSTTIIHRRELGGCVTHPAELGLLSYACAEKRRAEFILGREAAARSLSQLGIGHRTPILYGRHRNPLFPNGFVGTISHAGDYAVAAVARRTSHAGIGVDIELINEERDASIRDTVYPTVAFGPEREWINADPHTAPFKTLLLFSAKESVFKAVYPFCLRYIDFDSVSVKESMEIRTLIAFPSPDLRRLVAETSGMEFRTPLYIRWTEHRENGVRYIVTCVEIPCEGLHEISHSERYHADWT